ncbi:MAG: hypothetical protein H0W72_06275 [Planctomycetes bacterium]|nr:hypothetical protein [Planctomycetota bacterium]
MRIDHRHLDDIESLPAGVDVPLEQIAEPWRSLAADWFSLTATEQWDDLLLPPAAAGIYGLPMPSDMPRPGTVAAWTHREWIGWATGRGFEEVPRSKHAYQYRHRLAPWLLLSMSSSPGDHRWSMATATDMRFAVDAAIKRLGANLYIAVQVVATNTERHPSSAARERLRLLRAALLDASTDRDAALRWVAVHGDATWDHFDLVAPDPEMVGAVRALFGTLAKEFDCSPRAALRRLGHDAETAALLSKRLSGSTSSDLLPGDLQESLEDLVDGLREERGSLERAKDAARAARPGEDLGATIQPSATASVDPAAELRQDLRRRLEVLRASADAVARAAADVIAGIEAAALSTPDDLERLRSENAELTRRLAEVQAQAPAQAPTRKPTRRRVQRGAADETDQA